MSEAGFSEVPIGTVARLNQKAETTEPSKTYRQIGVKLWGTGAYERESVKGAQTKYKTLFLMEEGDIVVNKIWARNGSVAVVTNELAGSYGSNEFPTFTPDRSQLDPMWFHWITKARFFWERCDEQSRGTSGQNRIKPEKFLKINIPLPPLSEQRRIVERLEHLASKIEEARELHSEAQKYSTSLMEAAVNRSFEALVNTETKRLASVTSKIGSGSTPKGGKSVYLDKGIPFFRSLNVRMRAFQWKDLAFVDSETHQIMRSTHVQPGDVLLNITGASIGRVACAPSQIETANVNQHVSITRPLPILNNRFLMYWLSQPLMQEAINDQQKGATRQALTKGQIEAFEIPLPSISEQLKIVDYLDSFQAKVDSLKQLQGQTRGELDALLPSILDKAFRGEL